MLLVQLPSPATGKDLMTEMSDAPDDPATIAELRAELAAAAQRQDVLVHELDHRVKNTLAMVQAVARQSFRGDRDPAAALVAFESRLAVLARVHSHLAQHNWRQLDLAGLVASALEPFDHARFTVDGPAVEIGPQPALTLAMAIQELGNNAIAYGALSAPEGRVAIGWEPGNADGRVRLRWEESGGPPVTAPGKKGFGSKLIRQAFGAELDFRPSGLVCSMEARLA